MNREIKPDRTVTFGEIEYENGEKALNWALEAANGRLLVLEKRAAKRGDSSRGVLRRKMDTEIAAIAGLKILLAKITGKPVLP
jgi:hypothetical protein